MNEQTEFEIKKLKITDINIANVVKELSENEELIKNNISISQKDSLAQIVYKGGTKGTARLEHLPNLTKNSSVVYAYELAFTPNINAEITGNKKGINCVLNYRGPEQNIANLGIVKTTLEESLRNHAYSER